MQTRNDNSGNNGHQSPQDRAVSNPDQWKTGSEELTDVQKDLLNTPGTSTREQEESGKRNDSATDR
jgi:hypothetical protein